MVDFVGYGSTASAFEGSAPAIGGSSANTNSIIRLNAGLADSNSNTNDFTAAAPPTPRNSASPANPPAGAPAVAADISGLSISNGLFPFNATGTASSNYIVQVSTNLGTTNWVSLATNPSPFTFTDTNATAFTNRFYRVKLKP